MLFNHLESIENNRKKGLNKLSVFEIGPVYNNSNSQDNILFALTSNNKNQNKYFGRNKFLNSVIFEGNESHIGKLIRVNVEKSNQNSLFGKVIDEMKAA